MDDKIMIPAIKRKVVENTNCVATVTYVVRAACENTSSCNISADARIYGNPCPETSKNLKIKYVCLARGGKFMNNLC